MRRKKCRAAACSRKVDDTRIFCNIHFAQLTPKLASPIAANAEAPPRARPEDRNRIHAGTRAAVEHLAKNEGRKQALSDARRGAALDPGQGGAGDATTAAGVERQLRADVPQGGTDRYDLR